MSLAFGLEKERLQRIVQIQLKSTIRKDVLNIVTILTSVKNLLRFSLVTLETLRSYSVCIKLLFHDMNLLNLSRDAAKIFSALLSIW